MSDERPFVMREVGDICHDCELLNLPGALCLFHGSAGDMAQGLAATTSRAAALQGVATELRDALTRLLEAWDMVRCNLGDHSCAARAVLGCEPTIIKARLALEKARELP